MTHTWPILPVLEVVVVPPVTVGVGFGAVVIVPEGVGEATVTGDDVLPETGTGAGDEPIVAPPLHAARGTSAKAIAIEREKPDVNMRRQHSAV
jgi:hypothetical protein